MTLTRARVLRPHDSVITRCVWISAIPRLFLSFYDDIHELSASKRILKLERLLPHILRATSLLKSYNFRNEATH